MKILVRDEWHEAELLRQANDSVFGLATGIRTRDYEQAWRFARARDWHRVEQYVQAVLDLDPV